MNVIDIAILSIILYSFIGFILVLSVEARWDYRSEVFEEKIELSFLKKLVFYGLCGGPVIWAVLCLMLVWNCVWWILSIITKPFRIVIKKLIIWLES